MSKIIIKNKLIINKICNKTKFKIIYIGNVKANFQISNIKD